MSDLVARYRTESTFICECTTSVWGDDDSDCGGHVLEFYTLSALSGGSRHVNESGICELPELACIALAAPRSPIPVYDTKPHPPTNSAQPRIAQNAHRLRDRSRHMDMHRPWHQCYTAR